MIDDDRRISQMRNLGPACEGWLNAGGIETAAEVHQLGIEEAYRRIVEAQVASGKKVVIHVAYLYALYGAIEDCDWRAVPEANKKELKAIADRLKRKYFG